MQTKSVQMAQTDGAPSCLACERVITDEVKALQCDKCCDKCAWKCIECLGISVDTYEMLLVDSTSNLRWFCDSCELTVMTKKNDGANAEGKMDEVLKLLEQLLDKSNNIEHRLNSIDKRLDDKADSSTVAQLEARIATVENRLEKTAVESASMGGVKGEVRVETSTETGGSRADLIEVNLNEIQDRNRRTGNVIIFNIEESSSEDPVERKLYDMTEVTDLVTAEMGITTTISNPVRMGPRKENMKWPRPLRIEVENETTKWKILKASKNLSTSGKETSRKIFMKKDMTPLERERDKDLRKQLLEKRNQAENSGDGTKWIIRRGKIIKSQ